MDLIQLLIEMIAKAFDTSAARPAPTGNQSDLVRQIQARIEAARLEQKPGAPRQAPPSHFTGNIPTQQRSKPGLFKQKGKGKRKAPPALPVAMPSVPLVSATVPRPAAPAKTKPAPTAVDSRALARWLRPQTLRTQFMLTEIFQPPVSLRPSHLD